MQFATRHSPLVTRIVSNRIRLLAPYWAAAVAAVSVPHIDLGHAHGRHSPCCSPTSTSIFALGSARTVCVRMTPSLATGQAASSVLLVASLAK